MDYNEAALGHLQNILRAKNPDAARLIRQKEQEVLADITKRVRVYDGAGMGELAPRFLTLIRDTVQAERAESFTTLPRCLEQAREGIGFFIVLVRFL